MLTKRLKDDDPNSYSVDIVQDTGDTDYVKDGVVYKNAPAKAVLVTSQSDLASLTDYEPGAIAYTAGFGSMWQLDVSGTWISFDE